MAFGGSLGISLPTGYPDRSLALSSLQSFKDMGVSTAPPAPHILLPPLSPPDFPVLPRCWRSCRPPLDPSCSFPSLSSLLPTGRSWKPLSTSSPSCSPPDPSTRHNDPMARGFIDPVRGRWDLGHLSTVRPPGCRWCPAPQSHTAPHHRAARGDMVASVPSGFHCVPTHTPAPPEPPFPLTLRKTGGF